ncbi:hypothetical protein BCR34DRAFT_561448 [Clohesyomyces aquaticus]|uniref:Uncharacterized protein n=1 Tax=Clohesyomyces aquaticus TaxID=1231657 RepID=A0A1Y1ZVQ4_9PLEO|nr:hypothetical protein BCR34DRAFT_561448 [Clohesyomyces aquaticus]
MLVPMGVVLLVVTMVLSRGGKEALWKNSVLAAMVKRMRVWEHEGLRVGTWGEMGHRAKEMRGRLERSRQCGLEIVRA